MSVTPVAMPIYEGQEFYVPAFEVRLAGRPAGQDVVRDILSLTYKDSVQDIDSFEIAINNWTPASASSCTWATRVRSGRCSPWRSRR